MPLEYRPDLGRVSRVEPWDQLAVPTKERIKEALRRGDKQAALELLEYMDKIESPIVAGHYPINLQTQFTAVADLFGEDDLEAMFRKIAHTVAIPVLSTDVEMPIEDLVAYHAEVKRTEFAEFEITEEPDRYVMTFTKCMPNGGMRVSRDSKGRLPRHLGRTSQPYDWSWGRAGVLYYCACECVATELAPIERRGHPLYITDCAIEDGGVCRRYYYKRAELIPEEYYTRLGKSRS